MISHPSRVRGLKLLSLCRLSLSMFAPITGAWIETIFGQSIEFTMLFAPITGAWIETRNGYATGCKSYSHPSRVRGLKLRYSNAFFDSVISHPSRVRGLKQPRDAPRHRRTFAPITGAWIETVGLAALSLALTSHPSRVRGLKQQALISS